MEFKDYYQTLGVAKTANADEIKKAFRKLARKHHPDVSKAADATTQMAAINEANDVLSDPEKRLAYDSLANAPQARAGGEFRPPPNWDAGFEFSGEGDGVPGDHSDFFEQLFGRAARAQRGSGNGGGGDFGSRGAARGGDHHARIELDLLDAYEGAERTITLRGARLDEHGRAVTEERSLQVKIPKGVFEGQHIRLAGRGGAGHGSAPAGDLLLEVAFKPDARWHAEGRDVHQRVLLAPWEAALGALATVHTPGGDTEVTVPAGWKPGRQLRLKGRGIPGIGSQAAGHLYLELALALPPAETDAARAAYAALALAFPTFQPRRGAGA
jgi:curved DNA-binding protein